MGLGRDVAAGKTSLPGPRGCGTFFGGTSGGNLQLRAGGRLSFEPRRVSSTWGATGMSGKMSQTLHDRSNRSLQTLASAAEIVAGARAHRDLKVKTAIASPRLGRAVVPLERHRKVGRCGPFGDKGYPGRARQFQPKFAAELARRDRFCGTNENAPDFADSFSHVRGHRDCCPIGIADRRLQCRRDNFD